MRREAPPPLIPCQSQHNSPRHSRHTRPLSESLPVNIVSRPGGTTVDRYAEFLQRQIDIDLEVLRSMREGAESGSSDSHYPTIFRGFRECELKARLLTLHLRCGGGGGPCDTAGVAFPPEDERGCATRAVLGLPYADRPGYLARWRP